MQNIREKIRIKNDIVEYVIIGAVIAHMIEGILICIFLLFSGILAAQNCYSVQSDSWYPPFQWEQYFETNGNPMVTPTPATINTSTICQGQNFVVTKNPTLHEDIKVFLNDSLIQDHGNPVTLNIGYETIIDVSFIGQDLGANGDPSASTVTLRIFKNDTLSSVEYTCVDSLIGTSDTILTTLVTECGCPTYMIISYEEQEVNVAQEDISMCNGDLLFLNRYNCSYVSPHGILYDIVDKVATTKDDQGMWTIKSNLEGCYAESDFWIEVHPTPVLVLNDVVSCQNTATKLYPSYSNGYSYEWRDSFDVVSRFDTLRLIEPTNSRYWLTITSIEGCKATDSLYVYEEFCCEKYLDENEIFIFAPNVFSPNMDGINDVWGIYGDPLVTIENISIFDRLGTLLYKGEDFNLPNENIWDGYYRGKLLNPQVLVFDIEARVGDCIIKRKGDITIVN